MKTIREWLESLDEPYRSQAIKNAEIDETRGDVTPNDTADSAISALYYAFVWDKSKQGHDYWSDLVDKLDETL